jgi:MFS family permease
MPTALGHRPTKVAVGSVETRSSWLVAIAALAIMSVSFGAPLVAVVGLRSIAEDLGGARSVPGLAISLAWLGSAAGGIAMGRVADRVGVRWTVVFGACMIGVGLTLSAGGAPWQLYLGHGLFLGLLGNAGINAPLYVYVSRWFDRRRGTALALISSGQYVAGAVWPSVFERAIAVVGWRQTMVLFGVAEAVAVVILAILVLRPSPEASQSGNALPDP